MDRSILEEIIGIGPKIAEKLAAEGVADLVTLAGLEDDDIDRLDIKLGLKGHIRSQDWVGQAQKLLAGEPEAVEATPVVEEPSEPDERDAALSAATDMIRELREQMAALQAEKAAAAARPVEQRSTVERSVKRRRLNRNLDYATVFGNHLGATFMQVRDGEEVFFNHAGLEIREGENAGSPREEEAEPEHQVRDERDFNPLNFLDGKAQYDFEFVRRAVKNRFGRQVKSMRDAKLVLHGILRQNH